MPPFPRISPRLPDHAFPKTRWSLIRRAANGSTSRSARAALEQICVSYWPPLYGFIRRQGYSGHDAEDLTQSFFAFLIRKKIYAKVDQRNGKFRSFLLAALKNFLANARDHARALKRGGGRFFLPLDPGRIAEAESLYQTRIHDWLTAPGERAFDRVWAETLVARCLEKLEAGYKKKGSGELFEALKIFLVPGGRALPSYGELSIRFGMPVPTLRCQVSRLRDDFRGTLRADVRRTVGSEVPEGEELHELFLALDGP